MRAKESEARQREKQHEVITCDHYPGHCLMTSYEDISSGLAGESLSHARCLQID